MNVAGIIVEYNPLHYGHIHHIKETRRLSGCDILIAVMSGNVVQRGEFSSVDKFQKTQWAIQSGVDIVVELPGVFSLQNANIFAHTSIQLLNSLGVQSIYFGSESGDISPLKTSAEIMRTDAFNERIKSYLKQGFSFPSSADKALSALSGNSLHQNPNDILGIQYINAVYDINPNIHIDTIKRIDSGYYDSFDVQKRIQSATAIRKRIEDNESIEMVVPDYVNKDYDKYINVNDYFPFIRYNLAKHTSQSLNRIFGCEEGIENYLIKSAASPDFESLINTLSTRRYTHAKIKRTLMFMMLNIEKNALTDFSVPYIRLLGMNQQGQAYISTIKNDLSLPLITKLKRTRHPYLDIELRISQIYTLISGRDIYRQEFAPVMIF